MDERIRDHGKDFIEVFLAMSSLETSKRFFTNMKGPSIHFGSLLFVELQVKTKKKAEIQALSSFGFQYVTEVYLPQKLREGDWI